MHVTSSPHPESVPNCYYEAGQGAQVVAVTPGGFVIPLPQKITNDSYPILNYILYI